MIKRFTSLLLIALTAASAAFAAAPKISFATKTHDFGTVREANGTVSCEFSFTNDGDAPLAIISARSSCGCTKPTFPRKPLMPGEKGVIKVTYNPKGRPGEFSKNITVKTSDKKNKSVKLRISGVVVPEK